MTTAEFIAQLEPVTSEPLAFSVAGDHVAAGYHVTEIKATDVHAMDCGGQVARWNEVVLQLLPSSSGSSDDPMSVGKFLGIYGRVDKAIGLPGDAEVRVEYGGVGASAVSYLVGAVERGSQGVSIELIAPGVVCKARDRSVGNVPSITAVAVPGASHQQAGGCCVPVSAEVAVEACCT